MKLGAGIEVLRLRALVSRPRSAQNDKSKSRSLRVTHKKDLSALSLEGVLHARGHSNSAAALDALREGTRNSTHVS